MESNQMKMRETLEAINCIDTRGLKRLLCELVEADIFDGGLINKTISAVEKARCALSAPARNCDVGKDVRTLLEEYIAMRGFTSDNQIRALYELALPVIEWLLEPTEKMKGESRWKRTN